MDSLARAANRAYLLAGVSLGVWAAAIALARTSEAKLILILPAVLLALSIWTLVNPARWQTCFFAAALLLPPLPIALGDSGPHVSLLFAGLGLFAGMLWMNQWRLAPSPVNGALSLLLLVLVSSIAAAAIYSGVEVAAGSLVRVMLFGITVYVFFYTASGPAQALNASNGIRRLYWIGVLSALFATVDFYFQFPAPAGYGPQFVWLDSGVYRRAQGVFYEAGTLGNLCAFFLIMIAVALSQPWTRTLISRKALAAGGCIFFAALVLSYSRSSLLNVMTALVVLAWLNRRRIRWARAAIGLSAGGAVAGVLTAKLFPEFFQAYWLRISASAEFFFSATEGVLSGRVATWYTLRDWILNHPWQAITGIGYKTLPYTNVVGSQLIGDNMYLTLLVETGVLGLAALLWLHAAILRSGLRAAYSDNPEKAFLGTWMVCFWSGEILQMLSVDLLTFWRVLPVYFWIFALAVRR